MIMLKYFSPVLISFEVKGGRRMYTVRRWELFVGHTYLKIFPESVLKERYAWSTTRPNEYYSFSSKEAAMKHYYISQSKKSSEEMVEEFI